MNRRDFGLAALALSGAAVGKPSIAGAQGPILRGLEDIEGDAIAELAYFIGEECYVFGFPLVMMDASNRILTATAKAGDYSAPYNQLLRMPGFVPPDFKTVVRVSVNALWSGGVFDLEKEPLVFSYPESDGRYFVIQLLNMWTDELKARRCSGRMACPVRRRGASAWVVSARSTVTASFRICRSSTTFWNFSQTCGGTRFIPRVRLNGSLGGQWLMTGEMFFAGPSGSGGCTVSIRCRIVGPKPAEVQQVHPSIAHSTAATTEGNSSSSPSPVVLTMRPPWSTTTGVAASRRSLTARAVPASSSPMRRE